GAAARCRRGGTQFIFCSYFDELMIRNALLTFSTFVSIVLFPWPLSALLVCITAFFEPLVPVAAGLFADTLYYAPGAGMPLFTLYGLVLSIIIVLVRSQLRASIIGE
ncbi:MAG: hypothetical protein AAB794_01740, partial [Patescibacteria group bacterium]